MNSSMNTVVQFAANQFPIAPGLLSHPPPSEPCANFARQSPRSLPRIRGLVDRPADYDVVCACSDRVGGLPTLSADARTDYLHAPDHLPKVRDPLWPRGRSDDPPCARRLCKPCQLVCDWGSELLASRMAHL